MSAAHRVSKQECARMRDLRAKGLSFRSIARLVGRSVTCVSDHARDVIVVRKPRPEDVRRARRMERMFERCNRLMAEARS